MHLEFPIKNHTNLTKAAAGLTIILNNLEIANIEADHYNAPSECYDDICAGARRAANTLAICFGFKNVDTLLDAMVAATSYKFVHRHTNFSMLITEQDDKFANL